MRVYCCVPCDWRRNVYNFLRDLQKLKQMRFERKKPRQNFKRFTESWWKSAPPPLPSPWPQDHAGLSIKDVVPAHDHLQQAKGFPADFKFINIENSSWYEWANRRRDGGRYGRHAVGKGSATHNDPRAILLSVREREAKWSSDAKVLVSLTEFYPEMSRHPYKNETTILFSLCLMIMNIHKAS